MAREAVRDSVVLLGFESSGKSAIFRGLSGKGTGDETNFRGSTVVCHSCFLSECACDLFDAPGVRTSGDSETTRMTLLRLKDSDAVLVVIRGTNAVPEIEAVLKEFGGRLEGKRVAVAVTFRDKAPAGLESFVDSVRRSLGVPAVALNAREMNSAEREELIWAIRSAAPLRGGARLSSEAAAQLQVVRPKPDWFGQRRIGPALATAVIAAMFGLPVWAAYKAAEAAQPVMDAALITPLKEAASAWPGLLQALLTGGYGAITLGWYSFLWAFPVVLLIGVSVALAEETGLKERVTASLDPALRRIGLQGRDLIPVLSGFGCNVVAVFQSRACSSCTRKSCVSLIAFGSACSYQIGASLSIFGASGHGWLFAPYLLTLFAVGALHTRLWHGALPAEHASAIAERPFLQAPGWRAVAWRVRSVIKQFLFQAMPIFIGICLAAALLDHLGVISRLAQLAAPGFAQIGLPGEVAPAVLFSILRKDGLLTLNQDGGTLIASLSAGQVFLTVYLASTLTACLVTLWTVRRELGARTALVMAGRQALTAVVSAGAIAFLIRFF